MPRKILLADDSVTAQNMGRRILSDAGYEVVTVNNGSAALKKITEQKPDVAILDIYMPGYGGIEICQRLKESGETANIPVLLTVGKLEPFKPEEARRVRADAHLVKPFEATELLAAVTKLEQKISGQPSVRAAGKGSKKSDSATSKGAKEQKFGDSESGWKQRLTIPAPKPAEEAETEPEETAPSTAFRSFAKTPSAESEEAKISGEATPASSAPEITADELAAIAAAAAAFGEKVDDPVEIPEPRSAFIDEGIARALEQTETIEQAEAVSASEQVAVPREVESALESSLSAVEEVHAVEVAQEPTALGEPDSPAVELQVAEANIVPDAVAEPIDPLMDAEVVAALDSLIPMGSYSTVASDTPQKISSDLAWANGNSVVSGPRWMAEEVSLAGDELTFILEQEMQKAYASAAQADVIQTNAKSAWTEIRQVGVNNPPPPDASQESRVVEVSDRSEPDPTGIETVATLDTNAAEAAVSVPDQVAPAEAVAQAHVSTAKGESIEQAAMIETPSATPQEEAAYAAAASASAEFRSISHPEPAEPAATPAEHPDRGATPSVPEASQQEAELAAAWAQWRQIRHSIASPQVTDQVANAAAAGYREMQKAASSTSEHSNESATAAPDSNAIASIVDSVLAELKPKLMEEIAKKLAKDSK